MATINSFPNNVNIEVGAENVMKWLHGRTSGVFAADNNCNVAAVQGEMAITVSDGNGWIANNNKDGVVWWIDNEKTSSQKLKLTVDAADSVLNRIDRVVVSWQTTNYADLPTVTILKGTPSSAAVPPELTNTNLMRQLSLARIIVPAGSTTVSHTNIVDERLDKSVCGIVTEAIDVDTTDMHLKYESALAEMRRAIEEAWSGEIPTGAVSQVYYATIPASAWTGSDGWWVASRIPCPGMLSSDKCFPDLQKIWNRDEGISETRAAIREAWGNVDSIWNGDGYFDVYAIEKPEVDIPVVILCIRK